MTSPLENITKKLEHLSKIQQNAEEKKILWEEMKILSAKAFDLQDEIVKELEQLEQTETDLVKLQSVFDTREMVWDLIAKIATRELEVKETTTKGHKNAHEKTPAKHECHYHHTNCECVENNTCDCNHNDCCCNHTKH
ncbi:MAG: hypothetical protein IKV03_06040 [Alphaproteobacteria bacterium]|nr:hypothetical protein [Alphaproteobacteria bacterium]